MSGANFPPAARFKLREGTLNHPRDLIGRTLQGRFVIIDVLGEGAMGIVYRGFDEVTLEEVAVKVLQPGLADQPEVVARFHREAAAARRVVHEGSVKVRGRGQEDGVHFIVMELLHGQSLGSLLAATGRLTEARAARIVADLCLALSVAHERGVIHRDIKPDNVMLIEGGDAMGERVKLLDFGIAKPASRPAGAIEDSFTSGEDTRYGALVGTPEYMAPEQCASCEIDHRADIYACGVMLYRMVTGRVPFEGDCPFQVCRMHLLRDPTPPREIVPWLRPAMEAVIEKAMCKAPSGRYQTAAELRDALRLLLIEDEDTDPSDPELPNREVHALSQAPSTPPVDVVALPPPPLEAALVKAIPTPPPLPRVAPRATPRRLSRPRYPARKARASYGRMIALGAALGAGVGSLVILLLPLLQP
jgi:serine/threonine-protein kinase